MSSRSRAREVALQSLYQLDLGRVVKPDGDQLAAIHRFHRGRLRSGPLVSFADALVAGVLAQQDGIDAALEARSENWRLSRMAATDRTVLRIATYELFHTDTPPRWLPMRRSNLPVGMAAATRRGLWPGFSAAW